MKILHINSTTKGGAAIATIRIHEGLLNLGYDSNLLTLEHSKKSIKQHYMYDGTIKSDLPVYPILSFKNLVIEKFFKKYEKKRKKYLDELSYRKQLKTPVKYGSFNSFSLFSYPDSCYDITSLEIFKNADLIHLHWVSEFIDIPSFFSQIDKPIVWTLHDSNPFMGGFHHPDDLSKNIKSHNVIENEIRLIKYKYLKSVNKLKVVSPSIWLREDAKKSIIFNDREVILNRNGVDKNRFRIKNKINCREVLNLPIDRKIFLIISSDLNDYRKGLDIVYGSISEIRSDALFLFCGSNFIFDESINVKYFGEVFDEELLSILYSAVDFTIIPSRLDNLPNILIESMMCGTPVISFDVSDFRLIFQDNKFGIIVNKMSSESLASEINNILSNEIIFNVNEIRDYALTLFDIDNTCFNYVSVYNSFSF
jgi:glycosyltransferase involved in cell wall biosynthesis